MCKRRVRGLEKTDGGRKNAPERCAKKMDSVDCRAGPEIHRCTIRAICGQVIYGLFRPRVGLLRILWEVSAIP